MLLHDWDKLEPSHTKSFARHQIASFRSPRKYTTSAPSLARGSCFAIRDEDLSGTSEGANMCALLGDGYKQGRAFEARLYLGYASRRDCLLSPQFRRSVRKALITPVRTTSRPKPASVAVKISQAAARFATRIEDHAYCLLGIFDVSMPSI